MRIPFTIFAVWLILAIPAALLIARAMRPVPPPQPPDRDWSPVTVPAEFAAVIREQVQR